MPDDYPIRLHHSSGTVTLSRAGIFHHNKKGVLHKKTGPAITYFNGGYECWINGELHKINGPAIMHLMDGEEIFNFYLNGKQYFSIDEYLKVCLELKLITLEEAVFLKLKYK